MDNVIIRDTLVRAFEIYSGSLAESYPEAVFEPSEKFERQMRKLIKSEKSVYHRLTLTKARRASRGDNERFGDKGTDFLILRYARSSGRRYRVRGRKRAKRCR